MPLSDSDFINAYTLHIPNAYHANDTFENKVIYALAYIGAGTVTSVTEKLRNLEPEINFDNTEIEQVLDNIYTKGLIKGYQEGGEMHYDTSKKLRPNDGKINTALIDPDADR